MNPAIQKTLSIVILIAVGFLLKKKIRNKEQMQGIKVLILSIALPATIFVALLQIEVQPQLLFLPVLALLINLALFVFSRYSLSIFGIDKDSARGRTLQLLIPSLAPGLSCFPFLIEYASEASLALAALADVGNKVFVLVLLYLLAMHWHFRMQDQMRRSPTSRVKGLLLSMLKEPVNLTIIAALILLNLGIPLDRFPAFLQEPVRKMSIMMTPLVLLFIGMAVRVDWKQFRTIGSLLFFRSALGFLLSAIVLFMLPVTQIPGLAIVVVVFPQSAASFWPFAHISLVADAEKEGKKQTFDAALALNFLALSLPFSTLLILGICNVPSTFTNPGILLLSSSVFLLICFLPRLSIALKSIFTTKPLPRDKYAQPGQIEG